MTARGDSRVFTVLVALVFLLVTMKHLLDQSWFDGAITGSLGCVYLALAGKRATGSRAAHWATVAFLVAAYALLVAEMLID